MVHRGVAMCGGGARGGGVGVGVGGGGVQVVLVVGGVRDECSVELPHRVIAFVPRRCRRYLHARRCQGGQRKGEWVGG